MHIDKLPSPPKNLVNIYVYGGGIFIGIIVFYLLVTNHTSIFSGDDAHLLQLATKFTVIDFIVNPVINTYLSVANYTPFVEPIYRILLLLFGVSSTAFFSAMLISLIVLMLIFAKISTRITETHLAFFILAVTLALTDSVLSSLTRIYTIHYWLGAVMSFASAYMMFRLLAENKGSLLYEIGAAGFAILALFCKEIYAPTVVLVGLFALRSRSITLLTLIFSGCIIYLMMRYQVIGFGLHTQSGTSIFSFTSEYWWHFVSWYIEHHYFLLCITVISIILTHNQSRYYYLIALLYLLPAIGAPHGILNPEFYADRLLLPFNLVLAAISAWNLSHKFSANFKFPTLISGSQYAAIPTMLIIILLKINTIQDEYPPSEAAARDLIQQIITTAKDSGSSPLNIWVPSHFAQSALREALNQFDNRNIFITPNCNKLTYRPGKLWKATVGELDQRKAVLKQIDSKTLLDQCSPPDGWESEIQINTPVHVSKDNILSWDISVPSGITGGIYFPERGLVINTFRLSSRVAAPFPEEKVSIFAQNRSQLWVSPPVTIEVH